MWIAQGMHSACVLQKGAELFPLALCNLQQSGVLVFRKQNLS